MRHVQLVAPRFWSGMFDASPRRVGEATSTANQVTHELGHVIDLRPEFKAQRDRAKAQERKKTLETELGRLAGDLESMLTDFGKAIAADGVTAVPDAKKRNRAVDSANKAAEKANAADPAGRRRR